MALLVSDVFTEVRALLNDVQARVFTDAKLLPHFKRAYLQLTQKLRRNGHQASEAIDNNRLITAGIIVYPSALTDMMRPVQMMERAQGATEEDYIPMEEKTWEPATVPTGTLRFWVWRNNTINFLGATVNREVKLRYLKYFTPITAVTDTIQIQDSQMFLAARTASYAAFYIGQNQTRSIELKDQSILDLDDLLGIFAKERQHLPARRRSYRPRYMRHRSDYN